MTYQLVLFPSAQRDLLEIRTYFEETLQRSADRFIDKLIASLEPLRVTPNMYSPCRDEILATKGFRSFPVDNFLVFYKVAGATVQVHAVLYGRREFTALL